MAAQLWNRARRVKMVIFDVDGVFTDGRLYYGADNTELKAFHTRDGYGITLLHKADIRTAVISGRESSAVTRRMHELGIDEVFQGRSDKLPLFRDLLERHELKPEQCATIGDDLPDRLLIETAGLGVAVADAHPDIRELADWITPNPGGHGAVRDLADLIVRATSSE